MDNQQQYQWLNLDIEGKTESPLLAAIEKTVRTDNIKNSILKKKNDSKC